MAYRFDRRPGVTIIQYSRSLCTDRYAVALYCQRCLKTIPAKNFRWVDKRAHWSSICHDCLDRYKTLGEWALQEGRIEEGLQNAIVERDAAISTLRSLQSHSYSDDAINALCKTVVLCNKRIEDFEEWLALEELGRCPPEETSTAAGSEEDR